MAIRSIMAEFWIDVESDDSGHQAHVHELIVHDQVAGRSIWVYDLRFSVGRCASSDQAYARRPIRPMRLQKTSLKDIWLNSVVWSMS